MYYKHYKKYLSQKFDLKIEKEDAGNKIKEGTLISRETDESFPIFNFIPRFVPESNYADSFGVQWNKFKRTQLDSCNGKYLSFSRFWKNTRWLPKDLFASSVLEVGSGAGRFTEVLLNAGAEVVSFDYSNAVDANLDNNSDDNLLLLQADLFNLPLPENCFDYLFCYGVLQHTPDPEIAFNSLLKYLKSGGKFSMDIYLKIKGLAPWYTPKYLWRPITSKMDPQKLLKIIRLYIPFWLPLDTLIKKIPLMGFYLSSIIPIPCWNYLGLGLSFQERIEWAVMDTFDALAPKYDIPKTIEDVKNWCDETLIKDVSIFLGSNGIVINGSKK
jgi:SAM-dependent methyltransferase